MVVANAWSWLLVVYKATSSTHAKCVYPRCSSMNNCWPLLIVTSFSRQHDWFPTAHHLHGS
uniref:Uncharacterized protein n=1 Tax=Physcomitrium patens TaxID=3218 RepID=A0A2K1JCQ0_PHYPA|nr:hypothetical protein PHYPA_019588 [Physcomitrium patens]